MSAKQLHTTLAALLLTGSLIAQAPGNNGWRTFGIYPGRYQGSGFASSMTASADLNHDDIPDLVVSTALDPDSNLVLVYSGADNSILHEIYPPYYTETFGSRVAEVGDIDRDNVPDLAVSAPFGKNTSGMRYGLVFLFSGSDGSFLKVLEGESKASGFGSAIAGVEDLDGDQIPELLVSAPYQDTPGIGDAGVVYLLSGADGSLLHRMAGEGAGDRFGHSLAVLGDLDFDAIPEVLIGAPDKDLRGRAYVVSLASFLTLHSFDGEEHGDALGSTVAAAGLLDSDSVPDLLIAAPFADLPQAQDGGRVYVYSGVNFQPIRVHEGTAAQAHATSVAGAGDVNGDGSADVVIGYATANVGGKQRSGRVVVHSGATGAVLGELQGAKAMDQFGWAVIPAGDLDGDGRSEVAVGAPGAGALPEAGAAYVVGTRGLKAFGQAGQSYSGSYPRIHAVGIAELGTRFRVRLSEAPAHRDAALFLGLSKDSWFDGTRLRVLPLALGGYGMPGNHLYVSVDTQLGPVRTDGSGEASLEFRIPSSPSWVGRSLYAQWWVNDDPRVNPRGAVLSDAGAITVFPH